MSGEILLNGFSVVRLGDITKVENPPPYTDFVEKVLRLRKQRVLRRPRIELESISTLPESANSKCALVTIHREVVDPDLVHIGKVQEAGARS